VRHTELQMSDVRPLYLLEDVEVVLDCSNSQSCDINQDGFFTTIDRITSNPTHASAVNSFSTYKDKLRPRLIRFTSDGNRIVVIGTDKYSLSTSDHIGGKWTNLTRFPEVENISQIAISNNDGKIICEMETSCYLRIWDLNTKKILKDIDMTYQNPYRARYDIESMAFASDDKTFITSETNRLSGYHNERSLCRIWCVETGTVLKSVDTMPIFFNIIPMSNPQDFLVTTAGRGLFGFNVSTLNLSPFSIANGGNALDLVDVMTMNRDETMVAYSDTNAKNIGNIILCDRINPITDLTANDGHTERETFVLALSFSRDGKKLYSFDGFCLSTWSTNTYPRWNIKIHHTFSSDVKDCIKTMLCMITEYNNGGKRKRARLEIPRDVLMYIFSFFKRER
jgi:hypothetical protein